MNNQREIKFRAWDKQNETFHTWGALKHLPLWGYLDNPTYELMQYTGLKDKNGKEIYEGDILQYKDSYGKSCRYEVKMQIDRNISGFTFWSNMGVIYPNKIIGNIYENPELLKHE